MIWAVVILSCLVLTFTIWIIALNASNKKPRHAHVWGKWERGTIQIVTASGTPLYKRANQRRSCDECGFTEEEYI